MKTRTIKIAIPLLILFVSNLHLWGEVKIVRKLPDTPANKVEATWTPPKPRVEKKQPSIAKTKLSGRISMGGSGGQDASKTTNYDFFTDSKLSLIQPLGPTGLIQVTGNAYRKDVIGGNLQKYGGDFLFKISGFSFKFKGNYNDKETTVDEILKNDTNLLLNGVLNLNFLPTLPIQAIYNHKMGTKTDDSTPDTEGDEIKTEEKESDEAALKIAGTIANFGVSLANTFTNQRDKLNNVNTTSFSNKLSVTSPLLGFLKIATEISPDFSTVEYKDTNNSVSTTTLSSRLGLIFPIGEELSVDIYGGRLDTWLTREGPEAGVAGTDYQPHSAAWTSATGIDYKNDSGISAKTEYNLQAGESTFSHAVSASTGFRGKDDTILKSIEAAGKMSQNYNENWEITSNKATWKTGTKITPIDKMVLSASYSGGVSAPGAFSTNTPSWTHSGKASINHSPDPMLDYSLSAGLTNSIGETSNTLKQEYDSKVSLKPQWNLKLYLFEIGEQLTISNSSPTSISGSSGSEPNPSEIIVSTATYNMGIPILSFLKTRYRLKWEWINNLSSVSSVDTATGESNAGNHFQHLFGITLSGEPLPLTLTAEYLLNHGYRGLRHDVNSSLSVPIWGAFAVEGRFSLSYYEENGTVKMPFLFGLNMSYQF